MPITTNRRKDIYEAAAHLFRTKGFVATSMRDLAKEVNLNASSLYNHISSKEEILQEICFSTAQKFESGMAEVEAIEGRCTEKVNKLIEQHLWMATSDRTSITAFNDEWRHLSEPYLSEFIALRKDYENRFGRILEEGMRQGEFRKAPVNLVLFTLLSSLRWLYDWFEQGRSISLSELEKEMQDFILNGIREKES